MSLDNISSLLREEITELLQLLSDDRQLQEMVRYPLSSSDRPLSSYLSESRWTVLPLVVCHSICGDYERAVPLAASIGLYQTAGDVLDDIEDIDLRDSVVARYGHAAAVNAATTLLMLGQIALTRLHSKGVDSDAIVAITAELNRYGLTACIGQHRDIRHNTDPGTTEEVYLKTISMKSAAQVECAARTGAMVATDDQIHIDDFTAFGRNLGMAAQIVNDITGATTEDHARNDITTGSVTLPVIYALANAEGEDRQLIQSAYGQKTPISPETVEKVRQILYSTGAIQYAVVAAETYRQKALTALKKARNAGADVDMLENLLSELEPR